MHNDMLFHHEPIDSNSGVAGLLGKTKRVTEEKIENHFNAFTQMWFMNSDVCVEHCVQMPALRGHSTTWSGVRSAGIWTSMSAGIWSPWSGVQTHQCLTQRQSPLQLVRKELNFTENQKNVKTLREHEMNCTNLNSFKPPSEKLITSGKCRWEDAVFPN